ISHDDAATAAVAAVSLAPGTYNVCDDEPLRRRDYFTTIAAAAGVTPPRPMPGWITRLMGPTFELLGRSQRMSNAKLRATGWSPRYPSAREGLPAAIAAAGADAGERGRRAAAAASANG